MPKAVSLFSGCGGSDSGVIAAGFEVVMANDTLPYAREVYLANHPQTDYRLGTIRNIKNFPIAELLIGCYPCQGFSQGGVRDPSRRINTLYLEFARALHQIKPKAFIVENVSGMFRRDFRHLLDEQFKVFTEAGYKVKADLLNAADYGVAQHRKRIFIVGIRTDIDFHYEFPKPTHGPNAASQYRTVNDVIGDLPVWPVGEFCDDQYHWYYLSRNRRCEWEQPSKTIVANARHMPLHPVSPKLIRYGEDDWRFENSDRSRRFSYREASRIQGFKCDFRFPDTDHSSLAMRYTVIGNAVPPPLFEAVARSLPKVWD